MVAMLLIVSNTTFRFYITRQKLFKLKAFIKSNFYELDHMEIKSQNLATKTTLGNKDSQNLEKHIYIILFLYLYNN